MKLLLHALLACALLISVAPAARAAVATIDEVPAATLLLPYFETDLDNPNARNTVFRIGNVSATAALAHVTLWSDLGIPSLNFDVYLAGYDVTTIDMRLVFAGIVPQSSANLVNHGAYSLPPTSLPDCDTILPPGQLSDSLIQHLAQAHTGGPSPVFGGLCSGVTYGDNVARGYVTVDRVTRCSVLFPSDPGYFDGPSRLASDENTLWGEYWLIDRENNTSFGNNMVHIEASATDPATTTPDTPTFYGRFVGWSADDHREALPSTWQARAFQNSPVMDTTELMIWRDPGLLVQPFSCGTLPLPYPLNQQQIIAFDEFSNASVVTGSLIAPWAANAVSVDSTQFTTPFVYGYLALDLSTTVGSPVDPARQAFVTVVHGPPGRWAIANVGMPLDRVGFPEALAGQTRPAEPDEGQEVAP